MMYLCIIKQHEVHNKNRKIMKQTKIVASISDRNCSVEFLRELFNAGMNVVRINTAHAPADGIRQIVANTRKVSQHIGILIDTKGPEIRTTGCAAPIEYKTGDVVKIFGRPDVETTHDFINLSYVNFVNDINEGDHILFDDGALDMVVIGINGPAVIAQVQNDGVLGSKKSVNVPGVHIELPAVTEKDIANIHLAVDLGIDFIAHSFVRNAKDLKAVQDILDSRGSNIKIISKIENQEGVDNIDEIIANSYGIMIARGDLGIEVPIESIPGIQRKIINKCILAKKPVIVATQMLHSMISNPRPTRAEVTDIANAIYSCTDALMLSGETASGKYPVEAVKTMATIAEQAEHDRGYDGYEIPLSKNCDVPEFLARNAIDATEKLGVKGIITDSKSGYTVRNLAAFRGPNPVLAICENENVMRWLALSYGVIAVAQREQIGAKEQLLAALRMLRQKGYVQMDDKVAHLSGSFEKGGSTTYLKINKVSDMFKEL